jgi:hypothetical protein
VKGTDANVRGSCLASVKEMKAWNGEKHGGIMSLWKVLSVGNLCLIVAEKRRKGFVHAEKRRKSFEHS